MRHHVFYSRLSVSKSIFMFPWVIFFYCFCGGPPSCGGRGQLPSLPSVSLNLALACCTADPQQIRGERVYDKTGKSNACKKSTTIPQQIEVMEFERNSPSNSTRYSTVVSNFKLFITMLLPVTDSVERCFGIVVVALHRNRDFFSERLRLYR